MNNHGTFIVGLTGGIASGKSTVASYFKKLNIDVISADEVARYLMRPQSELLKTIEEYFTEHFNIDTLLTTDNSLDRTKLRELIFNEPQARQALDKLTHPAIKTEIQNRIGACQSRYVIIEIPLLIEANMQDLVNRILTIETSEPVQIKRIVQRDNVSAVHAQKILDAQLSNLQRRAHANDILHNNDGKSKLENQVSILHRAYQTCSQDNSNPVNLELH